MFPKRANGAFVRRCRNKFEGNVSKGECLRHSGERKMAQAIVPENSVRGVSRGGCYIGGENCDTSRLGKRRGGSEDGCDLEIIKGIQLSACDERGGSANVD